MIGSVLLLLLLLVTSANALTVKVLSVNHEQRTILILLPMHNTRLEGRLALNEPGIQVEPGRFYKAKLVSGRVDTLKRNWLQIETDKGAKVKFRLQRIQFLD